MTQQRLGKKIHISEPLGADGRGPMAPVLKERLRAIQNIKAISFTGPGERPLRPDLGSILAIIADEPGDERTRRLVETTMLSLYRENEPFVDFHRVRVEVDDQGSNIEITVNIVGTLRRTGEPFTPALKVVFPT